MRSTFTFTFAKSWLIAIFLHASVFAFGQTGSISGTLLDGSDSTGTTGVVGATIFLENTNYGAMSESDGTYAIRNIPAGTYTLIFMSFGYVADTIRNVEVANGSRLVFNRKMNVEVMSADEVVITAVRNTGSDVSVIEEKKNNDQVTEVIGSAEIARTAARNTADVAGRVPGITISEGRFVIVRGLSQRYNAVMINNALAPSSETDVKAFSFDIVPSSMVDRMVIYKTAAPELPGEFAGAAIKVYTKNIPTKNSASLGYSVGMRQYTTFNTFNEQHQGKNAWLGFNDGTYSLPETLPDNLQGATSTQQVGFNQAMNNNTNIWIPERKKAPLDQRVNLSLMGKVNLGKNVRLGNVTIGSYSNTYTTNILKRAGFNAYNSETQMQDTTYSAIDHQNFHAVNLGIMHNWGLKIKDNHLIEFKNLFNQFSQSQYIFREETHKADGFYRKDYFLRNLYRTMYTGQLAGNHTFKSIRTNFVWTVGYSKTLRDEPDTRRYRQQRLLDNPDDRLTTVMGQFANPYNLGRLFSRTDENIKMTSGSFEHQLNFYLVDSLKPVLRFGYYLEEKEREFRVRNLGYVVKNNKDIFQLGKLPIDQLFQPENFNATNKLLLSEASNPKFAYSASTKLFAYYLGIEVPVSRNLSIYPGVRIENNTQTLNSKDDSNNPIEVKSPIISYLPSVNVTYTLNPDTTLIRLAYAKTLNRPEFRELAPLAYYDFYTNITQEGNPNLRTPQIHNFDLRYEYYPRKGETFSIGGFYKRFINPIETYFVNSSNPNYTYGNAAFARSVGVEVEVKKSLFEVTNSKVIDDISLSLNGAVIQSKIDLGNIKTQESKRPMQGQSPYIINAAVYYDNEELDIQFNAIYNIIGKRIFIVGNKVGYPDVYEMPRNLLDLTLTKGLGRHFEVRAVLQNVFNTKFQFLQDANGDGKYERSGKIDQQIIGYRMGRYFTLGIAGNF